MRLQIVDKSVGINQIVEQNCHTKGVEGVLICLSKLGPCRILRRGENQRKLFGAKELSEQLVHLGDVFHYPVHHDLVRADGKAVGAGFFSAVELHKVFFKFQEIPFEFLMLRLMRLVSWVAAPLHQALLFAKMERDIILQELYDVAYLVFADAVVHRKDKVVDPAEKLFMLGVYRLVADGQVFCPFHRLF